MLNSAIMKIVQIVLDWLFPHHPRNARRVIRKFRLKPCDPYDFYFYGATDVTDIERRWRQLTFNSMLMR